MRIYLWPRVYMTISHTRFIECFRNKAFHSDLFLFRKCNCSIILYIMKLIFSLYNFKFSKSIYSFQSVNWIPVILTSQRIPLYRLHALRNPGAVVIVRRLAEKQKHQWDKCSNVKKSCMFPAKCNKYFTFHKLYLVYTYCLSYYLQRSF